MPEMGPMHRWRLDTGAAVLREDNDANIHVPPQFVDRNTDALHLVPALRSKDGQEVTMNTEAYRFKVGTFECIAVSDGLRQGLGAGFMYANAPEERLVQALQAHDLQRDQIEPLPLNCLLIETTEHLVLVDTGYGPSASRFPALENAGKLIRNLKSEGVELSDIDTVILTHGHKDHICGNIDAEGKPVFPNARYFISKDEWEFLASTKRRCF